MFDEAWRYVDEFRVDHAAALWADQNPTKFEYQYPADVRDRVNAFKQMLAGAIGSRKLQANHSTNVFHSTGNYDASIVTRDELIRYARAKDLFPAFLFDTIAPDQSAGAADRPQPKNKGGRPPDYDWDMMWAHIVRIGMKEGELPDKQADLSRDVLDFFSIGMGGTSEEEYEPAYSSVKKRVSTLYKNIRRLEEAEQRPKTYSD